MDSLTQAALGAAVGHACWQHQLGRKALVTGTLLGTLPDLDVVIYPVLDEVQRLYWHRGESHSVWFLLLGSIALGWLLKRSRTSQQLTLYQAVTGVFLILSTHVLIDLFNVYGTQLLAPLSRQSFSLNNMYIIDPLFTAPLLIGTIGAYAVNKKTAARWINHLGLLAAVVYAAWSFTGQAVADQKFREALAELDYEVGRQVTSTGPLTTLLWRHLAETPEGFLLGYWSWLDDANRDIRFQFIPRNAKVVESVRYSRPFETVTWFSRGWWFAVQNDQQTATVVDIRFTEIPSAPDRPYTQWQWPFAWTFRLDAQKQTTLKSARPAMPDPAKTLGLLNRRIQGRGGWLTPVE